MALSASDSKALKTLSLLARQAVFTSDAVIDAPESTLLKADASVFHPMPETIAQSETEGLEPTGYEAGFAAGKAQSERVFQETITMMEGVLAGLQADLSNATKAIEQSHARAIRESLSAVLPILGQHGMISEIERVLTEASKGALEGKLEARIHPDNAALKTYIEDRHVQDMNLVLDATQTETGISFVWSGGGVDIDPVGVAHSCMAIIGPDDGSNNASKERDVL